ncbi:N-acetyltransferase family protein [Aeromicrobium sp.]|uniref:GNAT family N-acetyltransferase n=1 Tax=Aeromicrobium sp. TaxID=1871063 RepID=UPI0030C38903
MKIADMPVVPMTEADWPAVESIYAAGISEGNATFESTTPSWAEFDRTRLNDHRLVAVSHDGDVVGWAACSPISSRSAYAGVVEHSIYVAPLARGQRIGSVLLSELISSTEEGGIWTIQSSIFPENLSSAALHERHGFRAVGTRHRIAKSATGPHSGQWRDTVLIERRSDAVGLS